MISEQELAELSFAGAPKIITGGVPGPKAGELLAEAPEFESMTRGGGGFPLVFDVGKGVTVKDPDGNLYIDVSAGVGVSSVGRSHPRVIETMERQSKILMHASDISNTKRGGLAKKIASIAPPGLRNNCISYFTQSGSGALECAIKFARRVTGRNQVLAFHGALGILVMPTAFATIGMDGVLVFFALFNLSGLFSPATCRAPGSTTWTCRCLRKSAIHGG